MAMARKKPFRVALVGTDSLRAQEIKNVLAEKRFPVTTVEFYDPQVEEEYSKLIEFAAEPRVIHHLDFSLLEGLDLVFLAADEATNRRCGKLALEKKFRAIDLHQTFAMDEKIPVIVAGVNDEVIIEQDAFLISNPHPATIILAHLLHLLKPQLGLVKVLAFVMQPASAFGEPGIEELANQSVSLLSTASLKKKVFREQIAFNLLAPIEKVGPDGFTANEKMIMAEVRRVLGEPELPISLCLIQVPVFHTYAIMTYLEFEKPVIIKEIETLFQVNPLFKLADARNRLTVNSVSVAGKEEIFIGQLKQEETFPCGLWIWAIADNLTCGSALNALEIARFLFNRRDEVSPVS